MNNAIILYDSMQPDCLLKVVPEIWTIQMPRFCMKNKNLNNDNFLAMYSRKIPLPRPGDPVRKERISIRLEPVIDQRFDGHPKEAVGQDEKRQGPMAY